MTNNYGRRKDDIMPPTEMTPEFLSGLSDSQKVHINLLQNITSLNTAVNDVQHKVTLHDAILLTGEENNPPILERMRNAERYINGLQETLRYWGRFIGGALILQTIGFLVGIIIAIVRFLPVLEKLAAQP